MLTSAMCLHRTDRRVHADRTYRIEHNDRRDAAYLDDEPVAIELWLTPGPFTETAAVCGDFTAWVPLVMDPTPEGRFHLDFVLPAHREMRYRFLLDERWWTNADVDHLDDEPAGVPPSVLVT